MVALTAKTFVGDARRTWRSNGVASIIRLFNMTVVEKFKSKMDDEKTKKKIKRGVGRRWISLLSVFLDECRELICVVRSKLDDDECRVLQDSIKNNKNKASTKEQKEQENGFTVCVVRKQTNYKAETATLGGKIEFKTLTKTGGHEPVIDVNIIARKLTTEMEEFTEQYGKNAELNTILEKKVFLKLHEVKRIISKNPNLSLVDAKKQTTSSNPVYDRSLQFLENQHEVLS